ncbi:hypothetical protein [Noviherbaspirillum galbum]|uniref:Helix-turn-helix domain-containing protein n=1 Tax=Noviherbaspirillum galbum TaxID=2709383 RepID=A0A6B3SMP2_9BURK|nr:hypothetical protein [Noviherbaspirillum galbum]NEX61728.1 hypothetical protein [Noviherbaspirillum galbum]
MTKRRHKDAKQKRDGGGFIAVPLSVLDCPAYLALSPGAVKLLWDIASQLRGDNNGRLYCAWVVMSARGWHSQTTLMKAKSELLESGLLFETRKGARPNKAAWYAVTWLALDEIDGMDVKPTAFPRGAYRHLKIASLTPVSGVAAAA